MEVFFLIVGSIVGLGFMILHGPKFYVSLFASHWKKVTGHILHLIVEEGEKFEGGRKTFQARIDYDYNYLGINRRASHFLARSDYDDRKDSKKRMDSYAMGQEINVYVYISCPSKSTLVSGVKYGNFVQFLFGVGVLVLCLIQLQNVI